MFPLTEICLKISSAKCPQFCLGLNVLITLTDSQTLEHSPTELFWENTKCILENCISNIFYN